MNEKSPSEGASPPGRFGLYRQAMLAGGLMLTGLAGATLVAQSQQWQVGRCARQTWEVEAPEAALSYEAAIRARRCRQLEGDYEARRNDAATRRAALIAWKAAYQDLEDHLARLQDFQRDAPGRERVGQWQSQAGHYGEAFLRLARNAESGVEVWGDEADAALRAPREGLETVAVDAERHATGRMNAAMARGRLLQDTIFSRARLINARAVIAVLALTLCWLWFCRRVLARVRVVAEAIGRYAAGDWRVRLKPRGGDELDVLARQCNAMADAVVSSREGLDQAGAAARATSRAKSEFLASVSEELRGPVQTSQGYTDMLLGTLSSPEDLEAAAAVKRNTEYVLEVLDDLRDLAKIETGQLPVVMAPCSPHGIVESVASSARVRAQAKGLALETEFDGPMPEQVVTDPGRIERVLLKLVGNAIKSTEIGTIRVVAGWIEGGGGPRLRFQVVDPGVGMTPQQMARLFGPLASDETPTADGLPATALGLTLSKRLTDLLGGTLEADSTPGCGSTFTLSIPGRLPSPEDARRRPDEAATKRESRPAHSPSLRGLGCRILLAEDGRENRRLISFVLERAGAEVDVAEDGQEAVDKVLQADRENTPFDLVLMDMQMPVLDGYDAARHLRQAGYHGAIIAVTGHTRDYDRQRCLEAGCDDYLPKPVDRDALLELVRRHARREASGMRT